MMKMPNHLKVHNFKYEWKKGLDYVMNNIEI